MKFNLPLLLTVSLPSAGVLAAILLVARHPFFAETNSAEPLGAKSAAAVAVEQIDPAILRNVASRVAPPFAKRIESLPMAAATPSFAKATMPPNFPAPAESIASAPPAELPLTPEEHDFLIKAAEVSIAEMQLAKLARERAGSEEVNVLAKELLIYQSRTAAALRELAKWKNVKVKMVANAAQLEFLATFRDTDGEEFDAAFREHITTDRWMALQVYWDGAAIARDSAVKAFAERTLGELKIERPLAAAAMREMQLKGAPGTVTAETTADAKKPAAKREMRRAIHPLGMARATQRPSREGALAIKVAKAQPARGTSPQRTDAPIAFTTAEQIERDVKKSPARAGASRSSRMSGSIAEQETDPMEIRNGPIPRRTPILVGGERPKMRSSAEETRIAIGLPALLTRP